MRENELEMIPETTETSEVLAPETGTPVADDVLLDVRNLKKHFVVAKSFFGKPIKWLKAVDNVSFTLKKGKTLGIVGESGCGKTTMGRTVLKLHQPTAGQIIFEGKDITNYTPKQMRALRTKMQIVFQDPYSSLPPRSTVGDILSEPVKVHGIVPPSEVKDYVLEIMEQCGLRDYYYERYPHEFSGGQRQRICIARALAVKPKFIVCDECVSALDVSIQSQIINLLEELKEKENLTYLFISHDLSVVRYISDRIGVMYLGNMVEMGTAEEVFSDPRHPYTVALLSSIPTTDMNALKKERIILEGNIPSPIRPPEGCKFHTRCYMACDKCKRVPPPYVEVTPGHHVACHFLDKKVDENGKYLFDLPETAKATERK